MSAKTDPPRDCPLCSRLVGFRHEARTKFPEWHNAPVPSFGARDGRLLVVGLAPGLKGANRTGRPFTGDFAGDLLYATLAEYGFANDRFAARIDDNLELRDALVTNAVRCVPPQNKPLPVEIATCRAFLIETMQGMPRLTAIVALGRIAHETVLRATATKLSAHPFRHGAQHALAIGTRTVTLFDSYHCSRYNTNTGVLTADMFRAVFAVVRASLDRAQAT